MTVTLPQVPKQRLLSDVNFGAGRFNSSGTEPNVMETITKGWAPVSVFGRHRVVICTMTWWDMDLAMRHPSRRFGLPCPAKRFWRQSR